MLELYKNEEEKKTILSTYSNPFKSDKVTCITYTIQNDWWSNHKTVYKARVQFESGDTKGDHNIKADDFPSLLKSTEDFIKSL